MPPTKRTIDWMKTYHKGEDLDVKCAECFLQHMLATAQDFGQTFPSLGIKLMGYLISFTFIQLRPILRNKSDYNDLPKNTRHY